MVKIVEQNESVKVLLAASGVAPIVFSCEHASGDLPADWRWSSADRRLCGTHWALDLGARELTEELVEEVSAVAIIAQCSRLLVDLNRPLNAPTLFRQVAEGELIAFNRSVNTVESEERVRRIYRPYHTEMDRWVGGMAHAPVFSIHSFTPCYEGAARAVEVGILFDDNAPQATALAAFLLAAGYHTALNEPWSGKGGLMFSPLSHARKHGRMSLELEVRNDLLSKPNWREAFRPILVEGLRSIGFLGPV